MINYEDENSFISDTSSGSDDDEGSFQLHLLVCKLALMEVQLMAVVRVWLLDLKLGFKKTIRCI